MELIGTTTINYQGNVLDFGKDFTRINYVEELRKTIKEKYRLLYVEISNLINIINTEKDMSNFVDIKAIEEETIKDYISVNYPTLKENNELINEVLDLKNRLIENEDYDEIISKMLTKGGSL